MSMHKTLLSAQEREGLISAGLPVDKPSQLADAFRLGMKHTDCMLGREVQAIKDATPKSNEELCVWLRKNSRGFTVILH